MASSVRTPGERIRARAYVAAWRKRRPDVVRGFVWVAAPTVSDMTNDYATAWDSLAQTIGAAKGRSSGSIDDLDHLTIDQRLKVAEVAALLSIAQELSAIHHAGINPEYDARA